MTASELLALLGLAWWRLLVYPGGIALLGALWLAARTTNREPRTANRESKTLFVRLRGLRGSKPWSAAHGVALAALIAPWLAIALFTLPGTRPLNRPLDVLVALALLDAPLFIAVAAALRAENGQWQQGVRRLAALNGYPVLILACALLSPNALTLDGLAQMPDSATLRDAAPHWLGAVTLLLALPALLNLGPFAVQRPHPAHNDAYVMIGLWLRAIGLTLIAAWPWLALLGERTWLAPLPLLLIALLLWGVHRAAAGGSVRRWGWGYVGLMFVQLLVLFARDALTS